MKISRAALAAILAVLPLAAAQGYYAPLAAGGLSFAAGPAIRIASLDLRISRDKVSGRMVLANGGDKAVEGAVTYALPDLAPGDFYESEIGKIGPDPVNFLGVRMLVDGKPVQGRAEQRAVLNGRDVTAVLKQLGLPPNSLLMKPHYQQLPETVMKKLVAAKLAEDDTGNYGRPRWTVLTRISWRQSFPAGKTVTLDYSYTPVTGNDLFGASDLDAAGRKTLAKEFCFQPAALDLAAQNLQRKVARDRNPYIMYYLTQYSFPKADKTTAPIGHFRLTLDKGKPGNAMSLCWKGNFRQASPTTLEFNADNYVPAQDIALKILGDL